MIFSPDNVNEMPLTIPGCVLWLDAADTSATNIVNTAGAVSQWTDKSGRGNHATQGGGALQPSTGTRSLSGLNIVDFPGDRYMGFANNNIFDNPFTVFCVSIADIISQIDTFISRRSGSVSGGFSVRCNGDSTNFTAFAAGDGPTLSTVNKAVVNTSANIHTVSFNGATSYSVNNGVVTTAGSVVYDNTTTISARLGADASGAVLDGAIAEIIIYNNIVTTDTKTLLNRYLANKWGISLS